MSADLVTWLKGALDEDERIAQASVPSPWTSRYDEDPDCNIYGDFGWVVRGAGVETEDSETGKATADHIARWDPARVLAEVAAKRALLVEIMSWQHDYIAEDSWYSCAQSVDSQTGAPGSGCGDDARAGTGCDCGLEHRRARILGPLAQVYRDRPGFDPSWLD